MGIGLFILVLIASLIGLNYVLDYFLVDKDDE